MLTLFWCISVDLLYNIMDLIEEILLASLCQLSIETTLLVADIVCLADRVNLSLGEEAAAFGLRERLGTQALHRD